MGLTHTEKERLLKLVKDNLRITYEEVGFIFGITRQRVSAICTSNGIDRRDLRRQAHIDWLLTIKTQSQAQKELSESDRVGVRLRNIAYSAVHIAKKKGILIPQDCESCNNQSKRDVQAHHDDYKKPLDVRWLCINCHTDWHHGNKAKN